MLYYIKNDEEYTMIICIEVNNYNEICININSFSEFTSDYKIEKDENNKPKLLILYIDKSKETKFIDTIKNIINEMSNTKNILVN